MAVRHKLWVEAGATLTRQFEYLDNDSEPFDLVGYTAQMQIRETADGELVLNVIPTINTVTGQVSIELSAAQTSQLTAPKYVWALELRGPDGDVVRLVEGGVAVLPEVVRD
jgi:hypothetical protein